jgi:hypothetical protein
LGLSTRPRHRGRGASEASRCRCQRASATRARTVEHVGDHRRLRRLKDSDLESGWVRVEECRPGAGDIFDGMRPTIIIHPVPNRGGIKSIKWVVSDLSVSVFNTREKPQDPVQTYVIVRPVSCATVGYPLAAGWCSPIGRVILCSHRRRGDHQHTCQSYPEKHRIAGGGHRLQ